jgi:hypothetical protein
MRTKQTGRKRTRGRPTRGVKKEPQKEIIAQVSFADEVSTRTQDNKTFKRREDVMIKSHKLFYRPTQANKGWYGPFTIVCIYKNDRVEV